MDEKKDKGLQGNEKIEEAILALQQEPTEELLAHALTVVRRRMREQGQFIVAVEPPSADVQEAVMQAAGTAMRLQAGGRASPPMKKNGGRRSPTSKNN